MEKSIVRGVRFPASLVKQLDDEAEAQGRDFSNYIRWLIATHPDRQAKASKKKK